MAVIDVTMDTAGVERGSFVLSDQLDKVSSRIKELTSVQNTFNAAGVQTGATIKGITKDGKEFTATLGLMSKAERDLAAAGVNVSTSLKNIKYKDAKKDTEELTTSTSKLREMANSLATSFKNLAVYRTFGAITDGLKEGIKDANKLQIEISKIRTISQGEGQQSTQKFSEDIRGVSNRTGVDVNEVAKGFYDTTSNQIAKGKETAAFVETAAQLARVTGSNTTDTVNLLSSRINAFGLNAQDADKLAAQFFLTIDEGRVVASEMANTLGRVDVIAHNLGVSMEEVNATIAITTQKGFKTADAMTLLTNLMIKLEKPTEETTKFFKSIGAESGEAAVKIAGGMVPLLRLIVEQVKAGKVPLGAFFDEIRGRKQFGVFEQSLPEIEAFIKKQQDLTKVMTTYNNAIKIRGESPADKINIELNKLSNVFKVDFGQEILKQAASFIEWASGADAATRNASALVEVLKVGSVVAVGYGAAMLIVAGYNAAAAISFKALGIAARQALAVMAPVLIGYAAFKATTLVLKQFDFGNTKAFKFLDVDPKELRAVGDEIGRLKQSYEDFKNSQKERINPFQGFEDQAKKMGAAYKELQGIIAKAITINDASFESAKAKSKETADAVKVAFGSWSDTIRGRVSEFHKEITKANEEIKKSKKEVLTFKDTLDEILFQTKLKYANDDDRFGNQKQAVVTEKIGSLRARGRQLFNEGTPEAVQEARRLFAEAAKLQADLKDLRVDREKDRLEKFGGPGEKTLIVDVNDLIRDQIGLKAELDGLEEQYQKKQQQRGKDYKEMAKTEDDRLKKLVQDFDAYNKIEILNKDNVVGEDFRTKGKFDPAKLDAKLKAAEDQIRKDGPTDYAERLKLEMAFLERRKALRKEAEAAELAESLKTEQAKNLGKEDKFKQDLEKIKADRKKIIDGQRDDEKVLLDFPKTNAAFVEKLASSGIISRDSKEIKEIVELMDKANQASTRATQNQIDVGGGIMGYDPARLDEARKANEKVLDKILEVRDKYGKPNAYQRNILGRTDSGPDLTITDDQGNEITPGSAKAAFGSSTDKLKKRNEEAKKNIGEEGALKKKFDEEVKEPLEKLKKLFPELATSSKEFTDSLGKGLVPVDEGLNGLIKKLERIKQLMAENAGQKVGALGNDGGDQAAFADTGSEVYAATGGIAGLFPGQPRGLDIYPIWAAKGEMIINARSAAMYKPMLEAIQSRRQPQYMAGGGRVGGDTNVGDITVNVNGGSTAADTGRIIGKGLERGIRRGTIRLNPRRNS